MNLGMIVRADKSGLGYQTKNLAQMLRPQRLLLINSQKHFGYQQFNQWYDGFSGVITKDLFPTRAEILKFVKGLTHLFSCEIFYSWDMLKIANQLMIKSYLQYNYEFMDNLVNPRIPLPTKFISPSYWKLQEVQQRFGKRVVYLPPPLFMNDFKNARETNFNKKHKRKFLHIVGKQAIHDRNGTLSVVEALKYTKSDFSLVIRSQYPLDIQVNDRRVSLEYTNIDSQEALYEGYDALLLPRRYGGLCLPCNEALASGLPVIMTKISPNTKLLPQKWLVSSLQGGSFQAKTPVDIYNAYPKALARKIDWLVKLPDKQLAIEKTEAFDLAYNNFSNTILKPKYEELINE